MIIKKYRAGKNKKQFLINEIKCDDCGIIYDESSKYESKYKKWGGEFCSKCLKIRSIRRLVEAGTLALSKLTKEERKINASLGGKATHTGGNGDTKSFSTDRWFKMTKEERYHQVITANNGLKEKLKNEEFKEKHFKKVFKSSKIGYISKGQREVFDILNNEKLIGFKLDGVLSNMKVDIINFDRKIAIEYNGDYYHCNPRTWKPNQFNKSIKMIASKKWKLDRLRKYQLIKRGYKVIIIWESKWKKNKNYYINKIKKIYYDGKIY